MDRFDPRREVRDGTCAVADLQLDSAVELYVAAGGVDRAIEALHGKIGELESGR